GPCATIPATILVCACAVYARTIAERTRTVRAAARRRICWSDRCMETPEYLAQSIPAKAPRTPGLSHTEVVCENRAANAVIPPPKGGGRPPERSEALGRGVCLRRVAAQK